MLKITDINSSSLSSTNVSFCSCETAVHGSTLRRLGSPLDDLRVVRPLNPILHLCVWWGRVETPALPWPLGKLLGCGEGPPYRRGPLGHWATGPQGLVIRGKNLADWRESDGGPGVVRVKARHILGPRTRQVSADVGQGEQLLLLLLCEMWIMHPSFFSIPFLSFFVVFLYLDIDLA